MSDAVKLEVTTDDGVAPCWLHNADPAKPRPGVLFYPDAGSLRPAMKTMAERVASWGYTVLVPHIFYRHGDYPPFDLKTVFTVPAERERLMKLVRSLDLASAMRDAGHYLRTLREHPGVSGEHVRTMGYCIGGRLAFATAGSHPDRVAAAASIHGGGIATDAPDSPHRNAPAIKARLYFGIADNDQSCTPEQQGQLVAALASAHLRYTIDHFAGALHGFAVSDFAVYQPGAAELHFERVRELFAASL